MSNLVTESFERIARNDASRPLIHALSEGRHLTASMLHAEAREMQTVLVTAGLVPGDAIVSQSANRAAFVGLVIACIDLEIAMLPVDRSMPVAEVRTLADRFGAAAIVWAESIAPLAESTVRTLPGGLALHRTPSPYASGQYAGIAIMKLTSGSTGVPKATATTSTNVWHDSQAIMESMDIGPDDMQLAVLPLSHAYGFGNLIGPLLCQGTPMVLRDTFMPSHVPHDIARFGVRIMHGVPFMFEHLMDALTDGVLPASLEVVITAGAPIESATVIRFHERFGRKIHSFYGTSETGGIAYDESPDVTGTVTVGRAMPNVTIALKADELAPEGAGRVHVSGPAVTPGYAGVSQSESEGFTDGGFLTGDLGVFDARGHLNLVGRVSTFVNVAGQKVQPAEVERAVREFPGVRDVRVLGAADARRGEVLVACVAADVSVRTAALREFCASRLAPHKIPREFVILDRLPVDVRGKTDRRALEAEIARRLVSR